MNIKDYFDIFDLKLSRSLGGVVKSTMAQRIKHALIGIHDYLFYGSTIGDYFELGFPNMKAKEKKTYITHRPYFKFAYAFDSKDNLDKYNSKHMEWLCLKEYYKRDQLFTMECTKKEFLQFIKENPVFLIKPDAEDCGKGIIKITAKEHNVDELFKQLRNEPAMLDQLVIQHSKLNELCPGSVNTIRIVTVKLEDRITIVGAALRMGSGESLVDNYSAGGYVGAIDINTGRIIAAGQDNTGKRFEKHPYSNVSIVGFQIPNWEMVLDTVREMALKYEINLVGWDIAVRETDVVLIEANIIPMIHAYQIAGNGGKRKIYEELYKQKTGRKLR